MRGDNGTACIERDPVYAPHEHEELRVSTHAAREHATPPAGSDDRPLVAQRR
jgi:hypothetical protein